MFRRRSPSGNISKANHDSMGNAEVAIFSSNSFTRQRGMLAIEDSVLTLHLTTGLFKVITRSL